MASDEQENSKPDSQKTVISTAAPTGVAIGTQIMGTFEITEHIATGGMGEVYRGFNIHTEEPVAIKIVLAALAHDEKILSMFQKEATVLGRLHHDAEVARPTRLDREPRVHAALDGRLEAGPPQGVLELGRGGRRGRRPPPRRAAGDVLVDDLRHEGLGVDRLGHRPAHLVEQR